METHLNPQSDSNEPSTASISTKYLQWAIFEESHLRDEKGGSRVFSVLRIQNSVFAYIRLALFYVVPYTNSCGEILFGWLRLANIYGHNHIHYNLISKVQ